MADRPLKDDEILHPLISETHARITARGWQASDEVLDLVNAMVSRGGPLTARIAGLLSPHLRAANHITIPDVVAMTSEAWVIAIRRAAAIASVGPARGRRPAPLPTETEALLALRVEIKDLKAFERLTVAGTIRCLSSWGWRKNSDLTRPTVPGFIFGTYWGNGRGSELLLPSEEVADRVEMLAAIVRDLEIVQGRSQLLIYRDLLAASLA